MLDLLVEDLPGELTRLLEHHAAVFGIGVVAEVGALVDEALAVSIDQDGERIGMLLELVADREISEFGRIHLPLHRMAARPVAARARADLHRHTDTVAVVEAGAAHLGEVPARPGIGGAPLGVGFEAAAGEHHCFAVDLALDAVVADAHAIHAYAVEHEAQRAGAVADVDAALRRGVGEHLDQAGTAADRLDREAAPELELAVDLECLAAVDRDEANALVAHPAKSIEAAPDQELDQVGVGAVLRHPRHVVEELLGGVGAEIGGGDLLLGEVGHQRLDVVDAVVDDAHRARGEPAVAARLVSRPRLQHHHRRAWSRRRQRRAERGVAAADHDHVCFRPRHSMPRTVLTARPRASGDPHFQSRGLSVPARAGTNGNYSAATAATPPWAFDQPAGSCMKVSTSASILASNLLLALAHARISHHEARWCSVTTSSERIVRLSG